MVESPLGMAPLGRVDGAFGEDPLGKPLNRSTSKIAQAASVRCAPKESVLYGGRVGSWIPPPAAAVLSGLFLLLLRGLCVRHLMKLRGELFARALPQSLLDEVTGLTTPGTDEALRFNFRLAIWLNNDFDRLHVILQHGH